MNEINVFKQATMSSLEIAELTGKRHDNVMVDIRKILDEVGISTPEFLGVYVNQQGRELPCFNLPRRECDLVIAGYSAKYRLAIIDRWQELESINNRPKTALELAKEQVALLEHIESLEAELDSAIRTKAEIGSRREATAMATASAATRKANALEIELDRSKDYCTIKRMQMIYHGMEFNWRALKQASIEMGILAVDVFDRNYGTVKAYHRDVWRETYALEF